MAVFFEFDGDIYGGESRDEVFAEMMRDCEGFDEGKMVEVPDITPIWATDEDENLTDEIVTLADEYTPGFGAHMVATRA